MFSTCFFITIAYSWCFTPKTIPVNKEFLGVYNISRYYTPIPNQKRYFLNRTYEDDLKMNTSGDPYVTADGYRLTAKDAHKVVACPPPMKMGTRLFIEGIGEVTCHDRGGAIKNKRLDLWAGIGDVGVNNIYSKARIYPGEKKVYLVK